MTNKLEILDGACGTGKTTGIFQWMIDNPKEKYLYVSPFLSEVEDRAINDLAVLDFVIPEDDKNAGLTKTDDLLEHLKFGRNITFTHSLFRMMTKPHIELIKNNQYILVIDEEYDLIEQFKEGYTSSDIKYLIGKNSLKIDYENLGRLIWIDDDDDLDEFKYSKLKSMCQLEMLYASKSSYSCLTIHLPIGLVAAAKRVILLSYRFEHSIMNSFVKMKGLEVVPFNDVKLGAFDKSIYKSLIEIIPHKNEKLYKDRHVLSLSWYENHSQKDFDTLANIITSICKKYKAVKKDVMWCSPSEYANQEKRNGKRLSPPSYGANPTETTEGCWIACSAKATNKYSHKWMLVHAFNRFPNQSLLIYLHDYGFDINYDEFALSETIQWVWRSRIRNNEPIKLCFIPLRMKNLFVNWLNEV